MRGKYDDTVLHLVSYPPNDTKPVKAKVPIVRIDGFARVKVNGRSVHFADRATTAALHGAISTGVVRKRRVL